MIGLVVAPVGGAVLIAGPSGSINSAAPGLDPGFVNVGTIGSSSGVYLRNGWVLTADHVGVGSIVLEGISYDPIPNSRVQLTNALGSDPDLILFKLTERPPLPDLVLASQPRSLGEWVFMIGNGRDRGAETIWNGSSGTPFSGWATAPSRTMRWGVNEIDGVGESFLATDSFSAGFDQLEGWQADWPEAQGVEGDSGGAAFHFNEGVSELVGLMIARSAGNAEQLSQPMNLALFENRTGIADLYVYRSQIESIIDQPDCSNGLDDDADGYLDFPADSGCSSSFDLDEVPEPGFLLSLWIGAIALRGFSESAKRGDPRESHRGSPQAG